MKGLRQKVIFNFFIFLFLGSIFVFILGCQPKIKYYLRAVPEEEIHYLASNIDPSSQGLNSWKDLIPSVKRSLEYVNSKPLNKKVFCSYLNITWRDLKRTLEKVLEVLPDLDKEPELLVKNFRWFELIPSPLFTGYYEPLVEASLKPRPDYPYPIYGIPKDLKKADLGQFHPRWKGEILIYRIENGYIKPYYTREEIEKLGVLKDKAKKIGWVKNLADLYFLQIQGSGRLILPDGRVIHIGFAGKNGRQFTSIRKILIESGIMTPGEVSMENIKKYFEKHPKIMEQIIYQDPSYVFFRLLPDGPYGAMNKKLTPYVSLATDPSILPLGSLLIFFLDLPKNDKFSYSSRIKGLGLAQDTGGAIKGHRIDLFCGFGDKAEYIAGHLKKEGRVFLLLAK